MAKLTKQFFDTKEKKEAVRINKYLSDAGVCSRREADRHIQAGDVQIDGILAVPGSKVILGQSVTFCGKDVTPESRLILLAFYKPKGVVCTTAKEEPDNIVDYINYESRIYPIGRLDKDSEGLILLTNHGDVADQILKGSHGNEKEYVVSVNKPLTAQFLKSMAEGVPILDTITKPCQIEAVDKMTFRIILTQGLNRQIRRMCEALDYRVLKLKRVRIMNICLGRLNEGTYRNVTEEELEELKNLLSKNKRDSNSIKQIPQINQFKEQIQAAKAISKKKEGSGKKKHKMENMLQKEERVRSRYKKNNPLRKFEHKREKFQVQKTKRSYRNKKIDN